VISNPGDEDFDISGFRFTSGISLDFPIGRKVRAKGCEYITNDSSAELWISHKTDPYKWDVGRLADEGEAIELVDQSGIIVDRVRYNNKAQWPILETGSGIQLISDKVDNHFGENWEAMIIDNMVGTLNIANDLSLKVFPNPTNGRIFIEGLNTEKGTLHIFNLSGMKVLSEDFNRSNVSLDLSNFQQGVYILKLGDKTERIVLTK